MDSQGDLFIADYDNNVIREVNATTHVITTVAGNSTAGYSGDNGPAASAELNHPHSVAVDSQGDLFIADYDNNVIREVNATTHVITTVAGNHTAGYSGDNGPAVSAELYGPFDVAVDSQGDLFIADELNHVIREVNATTHVITTVAGNGDYGYSGDNGQAVSAELSFPSGVAVDSQGDLFIADTINDVIRAEGTPPDTTTPTVTSPTIANVTSTSATLGGDATSDGGATITTCGVVYALTSTNANPQIGGTGVTNLPTSGTTGVFTVNASSLTPGATYSFEAYATNSVGTSYTSVSTFTTGAVVPTVTTPTSASVTSTSATLGGDATSDGGASITTCGVVYALSSVNANPQLNGTGVSNLTTTGTTGVFTVNASSLTPGATYSFAAYATNSVGTSYTSVSTFTTPAISSVSPGGFVLVGGRTTNITWTNSNFTGNVDVLLSTNGGTSFSAIATNQSNSGSYAWTVPAGVDASTAEVRVQATAGGSPQGTSNVFALIQPGVITTVAGNGTQGFSGNNGAAVSAELDNPEGVALDSQGNLFIADFGNNVIREVNALTGVITTVAGNGTAGYTGDNGPAVSAELYGPRGVAVDSQGNLFIADHGNDVIREVNATTHVITTVAGNGRSATAATTVPPPAPD